MQNVKIDEAIKTLVNSNRSTPIGISYIVEPRHKKTGNRFYNAAKKSWEIEKIGEINGFVGVDYSSAVNNQRAREDITTDFEAFPLWNGVGVHLNKFLAQHSKTKKQYLKIMPKAIEIDENTFGVRAKVQYRWKESGTPLTMSEIEELSQFEATKSTSERQETEKPVFWQTIGLDNIIQMRFAGENYIIKK